MTGPDRRVPLIAQVRARQAEALAQLRHTNVVEHDGSRTMVDWTAARLDVTHDTARTSSPSPGPAPSGRSC